MRYSQLRYLLFIAVSLFSIACDQTPAHTKTEIEASMQRYDQFIREVNADSIALLYTPDGNLGNIAHGRDSIRRFLASFKNVTVLSMASTTDSIAIQGDSSVQTGTYRQVAVLSQNDTVHVKGTYRANWQWTPEYGWRIKRMLTTPTQ